MYRTYTKMLDLGATPTEEILEETYKAHKPENLRDAIVTLLLHKYAMKKLRSGFIDSPGTYRLKLTVKFPIMFWHKVHYKIERL